MYIPIYCLPLRSDKRKTIGRFLGMKIVVDPEVPKGEIRLQDKTGRILGRILTAPEGDEDEDE